MVLARLAAAGLNSTSPNAFSYDLVSSTWGTLLTRTDCTQLRRKSEQSGKPQNHGVSMSYELSSELLTITVVSCQTYRQSWPPFTNRRRTQGGYGGRSKRKLLKQKLNQALQDDSLLAHYDEAKPLLLACDASQCDLGAVLSHIMEYGKEKPVALRYLDVWTRARYSC